MLFPTIREKLSHWTNVNTEEEFVSHVLGKKVTSIHSADVSKVREIIQKALDANSRSLKRVDLPLLQNLSDLVSRLPGRADWSTWWRPARPGKLLKIVDDLIQNLLQQPEKFTQTQILQNKLITKMSPDNALDVMSFLSYNKQIVLRGTPYETPNPHFSDADFLLGAADAVHKMNQREVEALCKKAADIYIPSGRFDLNNLTTATNIHRLGLLLKGFFLHASLEKQDWFFDKTNELRGWTLAGTEDQEAAERECFLVHILYSLPQEMTQLYIREFRDSRPIDQPTLLGDHIQPILQRLPKLQSLKFRFCCKQVTSNAFKELKNHAIKELSLIRAYFFEEAFTEFFNQKERKYLEKLTIINLGSDYSMDIDWQALRESSLDSLQSLDVRLTSFNLSPEIAGEWNDSMRHLRTLELNNTPLDDATFFSIIRRNILLEELFVAECRNLTDRSLIEIANTLNALKALELDGYFSNESYDVFFNHQNVKQMEKLSLTQVNDDVLRAIANNMNHLKILNFRFCELTNAGVEAIVTSSKMQNLETLSFRNCYGLTEYMVTLLAQSPHMKNLRTLNLPFDHLSDETIDDILNSEHLKLREIELTGHKERFERFDVIKERLQAKGIELRD